MEPNIEVVWQAWRHRVLNIATTATFTVTVPLLTIALTSRALYPTPAMTIGFSAATVLLAIAAFARSLSNDVRLVFWLAAGFVTAFVGLVRMGMAGSGRILLMVMPLIAFLLSGARMGRYASVFSFFVFAGMLVLTAAGQVERWLVLRANPTQTGFWIVQAITWLLAFLPLAVIIDRFLHLQFRTIAAERASNLSLKEEVRKSTEAHRQLVVEMAERKRLEKELAESTERERRHLGHELHDGVCQLLTGARLQCAVVKRNLTAKKSTDAVSFGVVADALDEALDRTYELARELSSGKRVEREDLSHALDEFTRKIREVYDVHCDFETSGPIEGRLEGNRAAQVLRIAQEAVNNANKHAKATRILVSLRGAETEIALRVSDNGVGFTPGETRQKGMGIEIMGYRANLSGSTLMVKSAPGQGTEIGCIVPIHEARDEERE